tara:strand:- start:2044 stop:2379 length:336 start_codon:yes stop_codon:yes gene_type:complete
MYIFLYLPKLMTSIPYNSACRVNEIFNETLKKCVNHSGESINEIIDISQRRILQRTNIPRIPSSRINIEGEGFRNMHSTINHVPDELFFFIFIFLSFISYNYSNKIKRLFR